MSLPTDPIILYSVINTRLRDCYPSLDALCEDLNESRELLESRLSAAGFTYNESTNQFD